MRPKKTVLLFSASAQRAGVLRLVLDAWGYRVICVKDFDAEIMRLKQSGTLRGVRLILCDGLVPKAEWQATLLSLHLETPALYLYWQKPQPDLKFGMQLSRKVSMFIFRDACRQLTARKRGPKKASLSAQPAELQEAGAA